MAQGSDQIGSGEKVEVVKVNGLILTVIRLEQSDQLWNQLTSLGLNPYGEAYGVTIRLVE